MSDARKTANCSFPGITLISIEVSKNRVLPSIEELVYAPFLLYPFRYLMIFEIQVYHINMVCHMQDRLLPLVFCFSYLLILDKL